MDRGTGSIGRGRGDGEASPVGGGGGEGRGQEINPNPNPAGGGGVLRDPTSEEFRPVLCDGCRWSGELCFWEGFRRCG